jgi:hypothetical protein
MHVIKAIWRHAMVCTVYSLEHWQPQRQPAMLRSVLLLRALLMESSKPLPLLTTSLSISLKRNSFHFLCVHTTHSHTYYTHPHTPSHCFSSLSVPHPFTRHFISRTLNTIQEVWEGDSANWGLRAACAFLSYSPKGHTYSLYDVNFVLQTPVLKVDLCFLSSLRICFKKNFNSSLSGQLRNYFLCFLLADQNLKLHVSQIYVHL